MVLDAEVSCSFVPTLVFGKLTSGFIVAVKCGGLVHGEAEAVE